MLQWIICSEALMGTIVWGYENIVIGILILDIEEVSGWSLVQGRPESCEETKTKSFGTEVSVKFSDR